MTKTFFTKQTNDTKINKPAHKGDAGYDVNASSEPKIVGLLHEGSEGKVWKRIDYIEYDTGLSIKTGDDNFTLAFPRSSVSKYNLTLANSVGVIDTGYTNTIKLRFKYNFQPEDLIIIDDSIVGLVNMEKIYQKGDKICQLIFSQHNHPEELEQVESLEDTSRGLGGFGSTGN